MSGVLPASLISCASLPTVVVLPVPLTPTISMTCGVPSTGDRRVGRAQDREDLLLDQIAQGLAARCAARLHRADDPVGRGDADVGRDQQLPRARRASRRRSAAMRCAGVVGAADDLVEPLDELLLRAREGRLDLVEETHGSIGMRWSASGSLRAQHQRFDRAARGRCGRRARRPSAPRAAARRRGARRARARRRSCARLRRPSACSARMSASERPRAELDADAAVAAQIAGAGQHEIAQAAQPRQRFAPAALRARRAATSRPARA